MDQVIISDLHLRAVIGINEDERSHLWDIIVNLVLYTNFSIAGKSDDIKDCVNYATVVSMVQEYTEHARRHTVEALAEDIARLCLEIQEVQGVRVRVEKPDAVLFTRLVGVEIERFKDRPDLQQK
jgi:FolB domain-containing protein